MNILLLNWRDPWHPKAGGAESITHQHAKGWVKKGHTVTWITSQYNSAKKNEVKEGIQYIRYGNSLTVYFYGFMYTLRYGGLFDIVVDEIHGLPFFAPFATRTPVVAFIHEVAGRIWTYMVPFPFSYLGMIFESLFLFLYKNTYFWTVSESTKKELIRKGIQPQKINIILGPIEEKIIIKKHKKYIHPSYVFVSRLVKMKGVEDVLKAFSLIRKKQSNAMLHIIGTGDEHYKNHLLKNVKELEIEKYVFFHGKISHEEKIKIMGSCHLLLHASVKEGWGLVVLESASQGTPAIVYNVGGLRDIVQNNKTGVIVLKNTPECIATEALKLLSDTRKYTSMQVNGMKWASSIQWKSVLKHSDTYLKKVSRV